MGKSHETISDKQFIEAWKRLKSPTKVSQETGLSIRAVHSRRRSLEAIHKINLESEGATAKIRKSEMTPGNTRRQIDVKDGIVVVFSDAHFWPDEETPAFKALVKFCELHKQKIKAVVCNGDAFDGAAISRFPSINWNKLPTIKEELQACIDSLEQIEKAVTKNTELIWTLGNHDARFEQYLINNAPQLDGIQGTALKDWFPFWKACYSFWVNDDTIIKHRFKGGRYAGYNNLMAAGNTNIVTGHTHVLCVSPVTNYQGDFYGVQTGTLADPYSQKFDYCEDNPKDWRQGFAVLTWSDGKLLMPELVQIWDDETYQFRGELHKI